MEKLRADGTGKLPGFFIFSSSFFFFGRNSGGRPPTRPRLATGRAMCCAPGGLCRMAPSFDVFYFPRLADFRLISLRNWIWSDRVWLFPALHFSRHRKQLFFITGSGILAKTRYRARAPLKLISSREFFTDFLSDLTDHVHKWYAHLDFYSDRSRTSNTN